MTGLKDSTCGIVKKRGNTRETLLLLIVLLFELFVSSSYAEDWTFMGSAKNGDKWYLDNSSLIKNEPYVRYWNKQEVRDPGSSPTVQTLYGAKKVKEAIYFAEMDCETKRRRAIQITLYFIGGYSENYPGTEWLYVKPGTVEEFFYGKVCKGSTSSSNVAE